MKDGMTDDKPARVPARAKQRWNSPGAIDLAGTEGLADILGDECEKPLPLATRTHQLESRMRENRLSGLEGGGAVFRSPYPYRLSGFQGWKSLATSAWAMTTSGSRCKASK
jgi:hypothetical protein